VDIFFGDKKDTFLSQRINSQQVLHLAWDIILGHVIL